MQQVITIAKDGTSSGLQVKPGKGLDLQQLGRDIGVKASTVRASEIAWDEEEQAWFVDVLQEVGKGPLTVAKLCFEARLDREEVDRMAPSIDHKKSPLFTSPVYFGSYDDAVKVEIAYLDALRLKGQF